MPDFDKIRDRLMNKLAVETPELEHTDSYLEAEQPLEFLSPVLKDELDGRIKEMVFDLPRFATEAYDNRLDVQGFRFAGKEESDDELWNIFQENDGPLLSQQVQFEALGLGRAYTIVGEGESYGDVPLLTPESPFQCIHEIDPRTKDVGAGLKIWTDHDETDWASVYHPYGRVTWSQIRGEWRLHSTENNDFGVSRLVPFMNSPRVLAKARPGRADRRLGRSVFAGIIPMADAINKMLTDMMVSGEFHAMPRRWAVGLTEEDFTDDLGNPLKTWELIAGRIWASSNKDVKMGQFDEADLKVFHDTVKLLMQLAAQILALPPHYLTFTGDNPASADAIRSSEVQLVKRAERMQGAFSGRWERVQQLELLTMGYPKSREMNQIETLWSDPATPTGAQKADALSKLVTTKDGSGRSILPIEQAREDLGYTAGQRKRMREMDKEAYDPYLDRALRADDDTAGALQ